MEIWKDIHDYEGLYQVSDLGNVKSLKKDKEKIMKPFKDSQGYFTLSLYKNRKKKYNKVHRIVYEAFNGKTDLQIDHITEGNKTDNRLSNLQAITGRQNTTKHRLTTTKSSQYTGVCWYKKSNKWTSSITINRKQIHLGYFITEYEAHLAYENKLKSLI